MCVKNANCYKIDPNAAVEVILLILTAIFVFAFLVKPVVTVLFPKARQISLTSFGQDARIAASVTLICARPAYSGPGMTILSIRK